jgi:Ca-activated chloride channel homolog
MMRKFLFILITVFIAAGASAQQERKHIRQGVKDYESSDFGNAEVNFRKALDEKKESWEASYNTGNALYKQDKPEDAAEMYNELLKSETNKDRKADLYYNLGNTYLKKQEFQKSIDSYKNALRAKPDDEDARYNLAYAMSMLQQQEEQQNNQDQQQDQDSKEDEKDQEEQKDQNQNKQDDQQQPEEREGLSKEEAEAILNAIEDREKEVKEEAEKKRARAIATPNEKDW